MQSLKQRQLIAKRDADKIREILARKEAEKVPLESAFFYINHSAFSPENVLFGIFMVPP